MAISTVFEISSLDDGSVLVPERYDPRRRYKEPDGVRLADIVNLIREQISSETANSKGKYLVLSTGDAQYGMVKPTKPTRYGTDIGSIKNRVQPRQVIISRLRPYLKQVAFIDSGLVVQKEGSVELVCSSEFYVLDSVDKESIAFLVPFLLSKRVQSVLAASQEGGHHPRFNEHTLKSLPIPISLLERRIELSAMVERAVNLARQGFRMVENSIDAVDTDLKPNLND